MHHHPVAPPAAVALDMQQLRHHTKNALTRILAHVSSELSNSASARRVALEVERRVLLTASISDALFGLTRAPGPFAERLSALCESVLELMGEDGQCIGLTCTVSGDVPDAHQEAVLRVVHEYVGNAVKHGMHVRLVGRIEVNVRHGRAGTGLVVADDGWGCGPSPRQGGGMRVSAALAEAAGGRVSLAREGGWTVAGLVLPARSWADHTAPGEAISIG